MRRGDQQDEEEAPPGYMWMDVKSFDENGKPVFKKELVKLHMVGAPTEARDADDEIKKIANELKKQVEEKRNAKYTTFEAVKYTSQVVAGAMYKIKVKVGNDQYLHIRVLKNLPHKGGNVVLKEVDEATHKLADPL